MLSIVEHDHGTPKREGTKRQSASAAAMRSSISGVAAMICQGSSPGE